MKKTFIAFCLIILCRGIIDAKCFSITVILGLPESRCTVPKTATKDREFDCLKGKVHTVKSEFVVFVKNGEQFIKTAVSATNIVTYDRQGNRIETLNYGSKDYGTESSFSRVVYNFNSKGIATGWEEYNSVTKFPVKDVYTYDDQGKRIRQTVTYSSEQSILILTYDSKGRKIEERHYYPVPINSDGKQTDSSIEKYLNRFIKYKYDGNNVIETTDYNKEGSIIGRVLSNYENGNKTEIIVYSTDASANLVRTYRTSFKYDNKGNAIEKIIYNQDDSIKNRYFDAYDERGFRISRIVYDSNGRIVSKGSLTYQLDSHGNWLSYKSDNIKSSERINSGEPFSAELRTITYY